MRRAIWVVAFVAAAAGAAAGDLPAFPGAEGYGGASKGGRGGKVIHVTNLNERGPGSLAAALAARGPRIVVFDVGGTIELSRDLALPGGNGRLTLAGQTAPGGVTIIGGQFACPGWNRRGATEHLIVRHIRVRGTHNAATHGQGGDCFSFYKGRDAIADHCSFAGSRDETADAIHAQNITLQWCTVEEPALWGQGGNQHDEGNHNLGFISGYDAKNVSVNHNLFVHSAGRNPMVGAPPVEVCNNVVYNFKIGLQAGGDGDYNVIGNFYKRGPSERHITPYYGLGKGRYHFAGNRLDNGDVTGSVDNPWNKFKDVGFRNVAFWGGGSPLKRRTTVPFACKTTTAAKAYEAVLATAGAWPRDATTRRCVREVRQRTGGYGLGGPYERFPLRKNGPTSVQFDTDRDGMPDKWELAHGLDPADPADRNKTVPEGASDEDRHAGYTYVEFYLNELAGRIVGAEAELCTVKAVAKGEGRVVCAHSGEVPAWRARRKPVHVDWGGEHVFHRGSRVILKALPQTELRVGSPVRSRFAGWRIDGEEGGTDPVLELAVDGDVTVTAVFETK